MLFPTHLVVAYALGRRWELPAYWAVAGAALPDVVDKPLATAGVAPLYHTVGHSLLALLAGAVLVLAARSGTLGRAGEILAGGRGLALWTGWSSHLALDAVQMVINGRPADVAFLAWPFVWHRPAVQLGPVDFLFHYLWTPAFFVEVGLWIACAVVVRRASDPS